MGHLGKIAVIHSIDLLYTIKDASKTFEITNYVAFLL